MTTVTTPIPFPIWIEQILQDKKLSGMGHAQKPAQADLGLGWIYYGMARVLQPATVVVIGSYRGFVPLMMGRALADNGGTGRVLFIDPSLVDGFWREPAAVQAHFEKFGLTNIEHHAMTTQDFVQSETYRALTEVGLVFIDGHHSYELARLDYEAFAPLVSPKGALLFHDSIRVRFSRFYGADKAYEHRVCELMAELRRDLRWQVFDLPFGDGVTLVRRAGNPEALFA